MEQIKRSRSNSIDDYDNNYRKRINITTTTLETNSLTKEPVTTFEDLSNEVIYEIFEFLDHHHAFQSFEDLNKRYENLFAHSTLPIKINISSISKSTFHRYLTRIIVPHAHRITSLRLSSPFAGDMCLLLSPMMTKLTRLERLVINNTEGKYIEEVVNHLSCLPVLSALTIISSDYILNRNDIYKKISRSATLKYCQMLIESYNSQLELSIATNEFSSIEHLIINNMVLVNQLDSLLSYLPQLRRLSLGHLSSYGSRRTPKAPISLNYLTDVSLKLHSVDFIAFEQLVTHFFRHVQILRIITSFNWSAPLEYLNADRWEQLISTHMPDLSTFDFQHRYKIKHRNDDGRVYKSQANKFNSSFWIERQWFFEYLYYRTAHSEDAIFYSTNPYRRKCYMLLEESDNSITLYDLEMIIEDPIHHVYISSKNAIKQCVSDFPKATKLTLAETFNGPRDSIAIDLNRIIPLRQLTQLNLNCPRLSLEQIIKLLHLTPNVHTLKLNAIVLYEGDSTSIEQNELFRIVSNTNIVTNVTITKESTLEKIQLLVALFPRLEYFTINLYEEDLKSIARFLLTKANNNTRHLSSLCIPEKLCALMRHSYMEKLRLLIGSEKLLDDHALKSIDEKVYLWW